MTRRRGQRGISLLEVLVATSLFALVSSAVGSMAAGALLRTIENRHGTAAAMLAQDRLEQVRGLAYTGITGGTTSTTMDGQAFTVVTTVTPNQPASGMSRIHVAVSWTGPEGARSYAVDTIYTNVRG